MAEAMGIREVLSWIKTQPWWSFMIKMDSLGSVQAIRSSSLKLSYLGRVIEDCKILLVELKDREVSLRFVRRSVNKVAHFFARNASSLVDGRWRGDIVH